MNRSTHTLLFSFTIAIAGLVVTTVAMPTSAKTKLPVPAQDEYIDNWKHLDQHWDDAQRKNFYTTSQGSNLMPYDWFMALEQIGSQAPFAKHLDRYGFLPGYASGNPNGIVLPLGFVPDEPKRNIGEFNNKKWIGLTCAACHTGGFTVTKPGQAPIKYVIDGGQSNGDFGRFVKDLQVAIDETIHDSETFERFAKKVLGPNSKDTDRARLLGQFKSFAKYYNLRNQCFDNKTPGTNEEVPWGPGRVDAFGAIFNMASDFNLKNPQNHRPANAPVSFPFLWNIDRQDNIQWFAGVPNANFVDHLARNAGEVTGVFARIDVQPKGLWYNSSIKTTQLVALELWLHDLRPPKWPENVLGPIDTAKRDRGAKLYKQYCSTIVAGKSCHPALNQNGQVHIEPIDVQTDPTTVNNIFNAGRSSGILKGTSKVPFLPGTFDATTSATALTANEAANGIFTDIFPMIDPNSYFAENIKKWGDLLKKLLAWIKNKFGKSFTLPAPTPPPAVAKGYEARPLNGIWASPPYLHNGSVPNLYQLLLPSDRRLKEFYTGTYEYDPVHVGYQTEASFGGEKFNATLPGNLNSGHDYGTGDLTDDQRWDLIEYLKSL